MSLVSQSDFSQQSRLQSEEREYRVADVSCNVGQALRLQCNTTEYHDSGLQVSA